MILIYESVLQKPTLWGRQNKGVKSRMARDIEIEEVSKPTLENARAALERKAALYDKLKRGKTGGLTDKQYDSLLVDVCGVVALGCNALTLLTIGNFWTSSTNLVLEVVGRTAVETRMNH